MTDAELGGESPTPKVKSSRSPVLFVLVGGLGLLGCVASITGLTAAFSRIGLWLAFVPAIVLGGVLPVFLVVRASAALKRRRVPNLLRHLINLILYVLIHGAIFGVVTDWFARSSADYAKAAHDVVSVAGELPWVSGMLKKSSEGARIEFGRATPELQTKPETLDAGPRPIFGDAGPADVDAGPSEDKPAGTKLSERADKGRTVGRAAYVVETDAGDPGIVVATVRAGGGHKLELVSLAAHAASGNPTAVSVALDGSLAVVMGGAKVLVRGPGERLGAVRALNRNAALKVGELDTQVRRVADVIVGKGGAAVAVVELFITKEGGAGEVIQALLSLKGATPVKLRASGDSLPDAPADIVDGFALRRPSIDGAFCVVETFQQGGASVPVDTSGEQWQVNPERLLCGHLDNPAALAETARTDSAAGGIDGRSVQRFFSAFSLQSGGAVVHANFVEKGKESWMFTADSRSGVVALLAPLFSKGTAPWAGGPEHLDVEPEGKMALVKDNSLYVGAVNKPSSLHKLDALFVAAADGSGIGHASGLRSPRLSLGGGYTLVLADLARDKGRPQPALLLASDEDLSNGVAELLVSVGDAVKGTKLRALK